jgi:GcrA cell cycle regulator
VTWTDPARVELLKKLWADGLSASLIAAKLGGVTRNAVIGKSIRLGLPRRGKASPTSARRPAPRRNPAAPMSAPRGRDHRGHLVAAPQPTMHEGDTPRIATLDLEPWHCRWPCGDPSEAGATRPLFCGAAKQPGLPYCLAHARRAFATPPVSVPEVAMAQTLERELA